jgi:hypothetical protein
MCPCGIGLINIFIVEFGQCFRDLRTAAVVDTDKGDFGF